MQHGTTMVEINANVEETFFSYSTSGDQVAMVFKAWRKARNPWFFHGAPCFPSFFPCFLKYERMGVSLLSFFAKHTCFFDHIQ